MSIMIFKFTRAGVMPGTSIYFEAIEKPPAFEGNPHGPNPAIELHRQAKGGVLAATYQ